jgi:hypothetical protein
VHVSCASTAGLWLETYWDKVEYPDENGQIIVEDLERGRCWCSVHDPRKAEEKTRAREEAENALLSKLDVGTPIWCKMWVFWSLTEIVGCF